MKLVTEGTNRTTLVLKDGTQIFFSYETPVAGFHPVIGWFKTNERFSTTTLKHIGQFLNGAADVAVVEQDWITKLVGRI